MKKKNKLTWPPKWTRFKWAPGKMLLEGEKAAVIILIISPTECKLVYTHIGASSILVTRLMASRGPCFPENICCMSSSLGSNCGYVVSAVGKLAFMFLLSSNQMIGVCILNYTAL